jgi:hypothetical protein
MKPLPAVLLPGHSATSGLDPPQANWGKENAIMTRTAFASLLALALTTGAAHADNVVGGGSATMSGGGDNTTITYSTGGAGAGGALMRQPGQVARVVGNIDGIKIQYLTPAPAGPGREAWLVGGGDNAEVVYVRPR